MCPELNARDRGMRDYRNGVDLRDVPYVRMSLIYAWRGGWIAAHQAAGIEQHRADEHNERMAHAELYRRGYPCVDGRPYLNQ